MLIGTIVLSLIGVAEEELIKSFTSAALFMLIGTIVLSLIGVGLIIGAFFVK
jgi:hypothetical protein